MIKIARIAVTLGLLSSLGAQAYAAGLVVNDNDLRNDLAWLSDRGVIHLSLSTWPLSQEEIARALKKAKPSYSSEQVVLARINQRLSLLLIYIPCYYLKQRRDQRIDFINFVGVYLIISSLTSISANAFNRYMIAIGSFFVLLNFFLVIRFNIRRISVVALIFVFIINFVFQNIYLQRRPILLGTMWTGLYTPTVFSLLRTDQEFKLILNQIDDDGDWVKDKLATK